MRKSQQKESFLKGKWGIISLLTVVAVLILFYGGTVLAGTDNDGTVTLHIYKFWDYTERAAVTYHPNGGTGGSHDVVSVDSSYTIKNDTANNVSRDDHSFDGWNTNTDGTGNNFNTGSLYTPTSNITLFAKWLINPSVSGTFISPAPGSFREEIFFTDAKQSVMPRWKKLK